MAGNCLFVFALTLLSRTVFGTLLRKIEELTLYMLELKKENEELRKMIEEKESN
ncbi:MAG TPA: hypothetical protein PKY63_06720 [Bacteroidales bacterium]|nr:hypothetical protein [Bacteroidales bacterium]